MISTGFYTRDLFSSKCCTLVFSTAMYDGTDLSISLEPHLLEALKPLESLLPESLSNKLKPYLEPATSAQSVPSIPYSLLHTIAQWSRTAEGIASMKFQNLSPHAYTMVSLLAGTTTSPERKFPAYTPPDPHEERKRDYSDRKAVTTVINSLLSVGGSGVATWWAADKVGWKPEWVRVAIFSRVQRTYLSQCVPLIAPVEVVTCPPGCCCGRGFRNYLIYNLGVTTDSQTPTTEASFGSSS